MAALRRRHLLGRGDRRIERLFVPRPLYREILERAAADAPREIVGALLGANGRVEAWLEFENLWPDPGAFSIAAADRARAEQPDVLALLHSHPSDLPIPSGLDHEGAGRNTVHAILSLDPPRLCAWRLLDGQALPVPVEIA